MKSSDVLIERVALKWIIWHQAIPEGLHKNYFTGPREKIYECAERQWAEFGKVDQFLLPREHTVEIEEWINLYEECSPQMIERLRAFAAIRDSMRLFGITELDFDCDPKEIFRFLRSRQEDIGKILMQNDSKQYDHQESIRNILHHIEQASIGEKKIAGYPLGISALDRATNGFEIGKFYVIGACKKTGKSHFMIFCAVRLAQQKLKVLIDSLEMSAEQLNSLGISYLSGIDSLKFGRKMTTGEWQAISKASGEYSQLPIKIYKEASIPELRTRIISEKQKSGVDVVFVDFVQRMHCENYSRDRVREVESIAQGLADISRDLKVCVIALSQLSGAAEALEEDCIPDMRHLKESQGIPENADSIITIHNPRRHESPLDNTGKYIAPIFKVKVEGRYGLSGSVTEMYADLRTSTFASIDNNRKEGF